MSRDIKYIGMDVHKGAIVIAVLNGSGKLVMESVVETHASSILQFIHGLRDELHVTWEEGTWAAWLHDLLQLSLHSCTTEPASSAQLHETIKWEPPAGLATPLNHAAIQSAKTKIPSKKKGGPGCNHRTRVSQRGAEECFFLTSSLIG